MEEYIIGIDEAGRGPLAGPVAVGAVCVPSGFGWNALPGVGDSKSLTPAQREKVFAAIGALARRQMLMYAVGMAGPRIIDREGIVRALSRALSRTLARLAVAPSACSVRLDGALRAPCVYLNQTTIVGGDATDPAIGAASICAKVLRDRVMVRLARRFPQYGFAAHKGYGTRAHRAAIARHGLCPFHRRSFCTRLCRASLDAHHENARVVA